jgi:hypothetical protein
MPDPSKQTPSVKDMRRIVRHIETLLSLSGPNVPPGWEAAVLNDERWARSSNLALMMAVTGAECTMKAPPYGSPTQGVVGSSGWPDGVFAALLRASSLVIRIREGWGMPDQSPRERDRRHVEQTPELMPTVPLTVSDEDYEALLWVYGVLSSALEAIPPEGVEVGLRLAEGTEKEPASVEKLWWDHPDGYPRINGRKVAKVTPKARALIKALWAAAPGSMTLLQLVSAASRADVDTDRPDKVLADLITNKPEWDEVFELPGGGHRDGYRIKPSFLLPQNASN